MTNKFSFLRWVFGLVVIILIMMLYWSSILIEQDLKKVLIQMAELKQQLSTLRSETQSLKCQPSFSPSTKEKPSASTSQQQKDIYPNLLKEDLFFTQTLPKLVGKGFVPKGIRYEAMLGRPQNLHPFNSFKDVSSMLNMCIPSVGQLQFGKYETLAPSLAIKLEARPRKDMPDVNEYWIHLRDDLYWAPIQPEFVPADLKLAPHFFSPHRVTSHDFKFYYDVVMNPYLSESKASSLRTYYNDMEEIEIVDDQTFIVRWKPNAVYSPLGIQEKKIKYTSLGLTGALQPLPRFIYQYFPDGKKIVDDDSASNTYRTNSVWAQNFTQHWAKNLIASCGPWLFNGLSDEGVKFTRNADYFQQDQVLVQGLHYTFKESFEAIWQDFKAGKIDLCSLAPSQLPEWKNFLNSTVYRQQEARGLGIKSLEYVDLAYFYIGWNEATAFFSSKQVRKAMTMAIDRNRIIEQNLNNMGIPITGPFFRYSPAYDPTIEAWPFSPYEAARILEAEGWVDLNGDGIRDKIINGVRVPFRFTLTYYSKNMTTKVICDYLVTALKEIGVDCQLKGVDITDLSHTFEDKNFDALVMGWGMGSPPENPRQLWHSSGAKEKGSSNAIGFANHEIDEIIDKLDYEYDKQKRRALYHRFHQIIHEQQPYTFLYSPKKLLLYRDYVKNIFIPRDRQDLVPGADISEPDFRVIWLEDHENLFTMADEHL